MGDSLRYQTRLDLSLRFGNHVPHINCLNKKLNTILTISHIPRPPIQNLRNDDWCGRHLLGDHDSELTSETTQS